MRTALVCWVTRAAALFEHCGLTSDEVPVLIGTLGKALWSFGAFVAGSRDTDRIPGPEGASLHLHDGFAPTRRRPPLERPWKSRSVSPGAASRRVLALTARFRKAARDAGVALLGPGTLPFSR